MTLKMQHRPRTTAVVIMTALVPTLGHKALIDFALEMADNVDVFVSSRSFEPVSGEQRIEAFREHYSSNWDVDFILHADDEAPQNPSTEAEWDYWRDLILGLDKGEFNYDYFVSSEPYGKKMAELIRADFIPYDLDRKIVSIKGSDVRRDPLRFFDQLLPEFARDYVKKITLFGQESTGKTTMTEKIGRILRENAYTTHEFARPYLEGMNDKTITDHKMDVIRDGQYALQSSVYARRDRRFVFQDTDLLSTIGYNRIYGDRRDPRLESLFDLTKSHLYIVMNDEIPFVEDEIRYGGAVRESTKQFWIDLLEEFGCNYHVLKSTDPVDQCIEIVKLSHDLFDVTWKPIKDFERE